MPDPIRNHPAHQDLEASDAWRVLNPPSHGILERDSIFGSVDLTHHTREPVLAAQTIEGSSIVQAVRGLKRAAGTPEEKLGLLFPILNECDAGKRGETTQTYGDVDAVSRRQLAQYELDTVRRALHEFVSQMKEPEHFQFRALLTGRVSEHHALIFEALIRAGRISLDGVKVAEVVLPLLNSKHSSAAMFDYIAACGEGAAPLLLELLRLKGHDRYYLGGVTLNFNSLKIGPCIEKICAVMGEKAIPTLREALSTGTQGSKIQALKVLQKINHAPLCEDLIAALLESDDATLRREAILTVGHLGVQGEKYSSQLLAVGENEGEAITSACIYALGRIGVPLQRVAQAFRTHWGIIGDTEPEPGEQLEPGISGFLPSTVRTQISAAVRNVNDMAQFPERGCHITNVRVFLAGLVFFSERDTSALELIDRVWSSQIQTLRLGLVEALAEARNFDFAKPYLREALGQYPDAFDVSMYVLGFGEAGKRLLKEWVQELEEKISNTTDTSELAKLHRQLSVPKYFCAENLGE